jgi:hypothetical protein
MEIYLDGARQLTLQANIATVGAALVELNGWLQRNGRALQRISIDGREILAEELTLEIGNMPAAGVLRLDVTSARVVDLVIEALQEVEEVLPELPVACQTLAQILSGQAPEEGLDSLTQVLAIWAALIERRRQIADALTIDLTAVAAAGRSLADRDASLAQTLARVEGARDKRDFGGLAELIAYDLFEFAESEAEAFALLRARCAA